MNVVIDTERDQYILSLINNDIARLRAMRLSCLEQLQEDDISSDLNMVASNIERLSLVRAQINQIDKQLNLLSFAKKQEGEHMLGYCLSCGDSIPMERIIVNPSAVRCIDCENIVSQKNRTQFLVS